MSKIKQGINVICQACKNEFYVAKYRSETARFCSLHCQNHRQYERFKFKCKQCGKECESSPCRKGKKSFCSLVCSNEFQIDRKNCNREVCGYMEYECCLDIHHKDKDPNNNSLENLKVVCVMCHRKIHRKIINF